MKNWFCEIRGSSVGPLGVAQIQALHESGELGTPAQIRVAQSGRLLSETEVTALLAGKTGEIEASSGSEEADPRTPAASCDSCGRSIKWTGETCPYCGHNSSVPADPSPGGEVDPARFEFDAANDAANDTVGTLRIFYTAPLRMFGAFVKRLDWLNTARQISYGVGAMLSLLLFCLLIEIFIDRPVTLGMLAIVAGLFVVVAPLLLVMSTSDFLLLGLGLSLFKCQFPGPERTTRAIVEVTISKLLVVILWAIGDVFLVPLMKSAGEIGIWLVYAYASIPVVLFYLLPTSIYGQRFELAASKSAVIAFLTYLPQLLVMIAMIVIVASYAAALP